MAEAWCSYYWHLFLTDFVLNQFIFLKAFLEKFSGLPGIHNIHVTCREHQKRNETYEEKEDFVFIVWNKRTKKKEMIASEEC